MLGTLRSEHLHRIELQGDRVTRHDVHLRGEHGRLRTVTTGPDGALNVLTSNCDGRGDCPDDGDKVLRITAARR